VSLSDDASMLPPGRVPDLVCGFTRHAQRAACEVTARTSRLGLEILDVLTSPPFVRRPLEHVNALLVEVAEHGAQARRRDAAHLAELAARSRPLVDQLMRQVVELLPLNEILARIDVNALVARIDMNAILGQVDLGALITDALADLELGDLIHDSTTSVATDARDVVRIRVAAADRGFAGLIDRVLRRGDHDRGIPLVDLDGAT
jgi:hypothetical protein